MSDLISTNDNMKQQQQWKQFNNMMARLTFASRSRARCVAFSRIASSNRRSWMLPLFTGDARSSATKLSD